MSSTETLLTDSPYTGEQVASRPYEEMWEPYLSMSKSMCIFAPRMSGKSFALQKKFVETPNSVYITHNTEMARDVVRYLRRQDITRDIDFNRDVFSSNSAYRIETRNVDRIFIDEVCHFRTPLHELTRYLLPQMERGAIVTIATSPSGRDSYDELRRIFHCVRLPYDWIDNHSPINEVERIENYFEDGLFEI